MHFTDLSPHVHFLNDAAHLLSHSAPETSAFLMSRRTELLVENDISLSDAQRQHVCSACGHILIPGHQSTNLEIIKTDKSPRSKSKRRTPRTQQQTSSSKPAVPPSQTRTMPGGIAKVLSCGSCARKTSFKLEGPKRISRGRKTSTQQSKVPDERKLQAGAEPAKPSANASSKKRAKNRKAGLQALLDQRQGAASSSSSSSLGLGLSLSDFMKK